MPWKTFLMTHIEKRSKFGVKEREEHYRICIRTHQGNSFGRLMNDWR